MAKILQAKLLLNISGFKASAKGAQSSVDTFKRAAIAAANDGVSPLEIRTKAASSGMAAYKQAMRGGATATQAEAQAAKAAAQAVAQLGGAQQRTAQTTQQSTVAQQSYTDKLAKLAVAAGVAGAAVSTARRVIGGFVELNQAGAQVVNLDRQFRRVSGSAMQMSENLEALRRGTRGMATDSQLMAQGITLIASGLAETPQELENVSKTVTALGRTFQKLSADRSMQTYMMMIANESEMRFDSFGINAGEARERIEELTAAGMDSKDAFKTAVDEQMLANYEMLGLSAEQAGEGAGQLTAQLGNLKDTIKKDLMPVTSDAVGFMSSILNGLTQAWMNVKAVGVAVIAAFNAGIYTWGEGLKGGVMRLMQAKELLAGNAEAARDFGEASTEAWRRAFSGEVADEAFRDTVLRFYGDTADVAQDTADEIVTTANDAAAAIAETAQELADVQAAIAADIAEVEAQSREKIAEDAIRQARRAVDEIIREKRREEDAVIRLARQAEDAALRAADAATARQAQYAASVQSAQRQHAKKMVTIEQNYRRQIAKIQQKFEQSRDSAIDSRDALALVKAEQQRDRELVEAGQQRSDQVAQANTQYTEQIQQAEAALVKAETAARDSLKRQEENQRLSLKRQAEDKRLADERKAEDDALALTRRQEDLQKWLDARIAQIRGEHVLEFTDAVQHHQNMLSEQSRYLSAMNAMRMIISPSQSVRGRRAAGGYAGRGLYELGERGREFVLSAPTTQAVERAAGGSLSQQQVLAMLGGSAAGGAGGRANVRITQDFTFHGSMSANEKQWFRETAYEQAALAINEVYS